MDVFKCSEIGGLYTMDRPLQYNRQSDSAVSKCAMSLHNLVHDVRPRRNAAPTEAQPTAVLAKGMTAVEFALGGGYIEIRQTSTERRARVSARETILSC